MSAPLTPVIGPRTLIAQQTHQEKYELPEEGFIGCMQRVAGAMGEGKEHKAKLLDIFLDQRFLAAGRVQAAMGSPKRVTAFNCLGGRTKLLTSNGVVPISQVSGKEVEILSPVTGSWHKTVVNSHGVRNLNQVDISLGFRKSGEKFSVFATPDHRWLLNDGSFTDNLSEGDLLAVGKFELPTGPRFELGFVHGFTFGDGTQDKAATKTLTFATPLCADKDQKYKEIFERCPWKSGVWFGCGWPVFRLKPPVHLKQLPDDSEGPEYIAGFIRGWIAADGCLCGTAAGLPAKAGSRPSMLHSVNTEALEWVQDRMILAGYTPSGYRTNPAGELITWPEREGRKISGTFARIRDLGCVYFRLSEEHFGMRVVNINPAGAEETFCCSVPEGGGAFVIDKGVASGNCFVGGIMEDTFVDGEGSIMHRAMQAAVTMRSGGGLGTNYGTLRPRGARVKKIMGVSSGPVTFMHIQDAVGHATSSYGNRRGAQMGVLPVDHPDIEEFIDSKKPPAAAAPIMEMVDYWKEAAKLGDPVAVQKFWSWMNALQATLRLTGFNISVGIYDAFMESLERGESYKLRFGNKVYREISSSELWEKIMRSTWDWAEPGTLFLDTINRENNLWYGEKITACNPCAEQSLPPHGACLLGSFNLVKYLCARTDGSRYFSFDRLVEDIPTVVRAMDNVIDQAIYPLPEQEREAQNKRRMGLGVTGLANTLEALGLPYGDPGFLEMQGDILKTIAHECYSASIKLAEEKGAFPFLDAEKYLQSGHNKRVLTDEHRDGIRKHGIRNSHLTSIAPTGTISLTADNVSSGIEPVFAYHQKRQINFLDGKKQVDLVDYGVDNFKVRGRKADQVTAQQHLDVLLTAQKWVDSAVSKTCNVSGDMPWADFKDIYRKAWAGGAKGITTFNKDGKRSGILTDNDAAEVGLSCSVDSSGRKSCE